MRIFQQPVKKAIRKIIQWSYSDHDHMGYNFWPGLLIIIEGGIGVGKTTLAKALSERIENSVVYEEYIDLNLLNKFLADRKTYGYTMQIRQLTWRFIAHQKAVKEILNEGKVVICDRSIYGDLAFLLALNEEGHISDYDVQTYQELRKVMFQFLMPPQLLIYLEADSEELLRRQKKRIEEDPSRSSEIAYNTDYMDLLKKHYESVIDSLPEGTRIKRYDWKDNYGVDNLGLQSIPQIKRFLHDS